MIVPALAVLAVAVVLSGAAFAVLWLDRYKAEPVLRLVFAAGWGLLWSLILRLAFPGLSPLADPGFTAGIVAVLPALVLLLEELLLAAGLAALATSRYLQGPVDGVVYGTVAGLGLAIFQTLAALHGGWLPSHPTMPVLTALVVADGTALVGGGIGYGKLVVRRPLRVPWVFVVVLVASLSAWVLHGAATVGWQRWGRQNVLFGLALVATALLLLAALFEGAWALERRVLARQLGEEVSLGVLPAWVVDIVPRYHRRIRSDWWPRRDERREVVRLLTSLAYRKQQLRGLSEESLRLYGLEIGRLRQRARSLLALAGGATPVAGLEG
jgi:hypothetical protein